MTAINLVIGDLTSIVDDSVQFYWDILSAEDAASEGLCKGARLHFERIPARLACLDCSHEYILEGDLTLCPQCQSAQVRIIGGDEFRVDSIAIET